MPVEKALAYRQRYPDSLGRTAVLLFVLLAAVYLASYSGLFHSVDELPVVALTQNMVQRGALDINQLVWAQDSTPNYLGSYGADDNLYSKRGLGMTLAAVPFYCAGQWLPGVGAARAALLTNGLVTALTAVLLFLYIVELGYRLETGLLVALSYGLGSIAWVYARYLFTEPLAALGLTGTAYFLLRRQSRLAPWDAALGGAALGLAVMARAEYLLALPFFLAYLGGVRRTSDVRRTLVPFLLPLALAGFAILVYNWVRSGSFLETGYSAELIFSTPLLEGLGGFLFSPGRSIFLYCPVVLAGLGGMSLLLKERRREAWLIGALSLAFLLLYSVWHSWHGGWSWGPRLLLPILPLLLVPVAPLWERGRASGSRLAVGGLALLVGFSIAVQIPGVAVDFSRYLKELLEIDPSPWAPISDPRYTPLIGHLQLLWRGALDLAWVRDGAVQWALLLPAAGLAVVASAALLWELQAKPPAGDNPAGGWRSRASSITLLLPLIAWWMLQGSYSGGYSAYEKMNRQVIARLDGATRPRDVLIIDFQPFSPLFETTVFFLNHYHISTPYYAWVRTGDPRGGTPERRQETLQAIGGRYERAWLLLPDTLQGDTASATERWFAEHAFKFRHDWFDASTRLALYSLPSPGSAPPRRAVGADFGPGIILRSYALAVRGPGDARRESGAALPGDALQLALFWQSEVQTGFDLVVFVQLLDERGEMRVGRDSRPVDDMRPTPSWRVGEEIEDHHALLLPEDIPPGTYRLIVGLYDPLSQQRAPVVDDSGAIVGDATTLTEIKIGATQLGRNEKGRKADDRNGN
jgi:hypothetical protein